LILYGLPNSAHDVFRLCFCYAWGDLVTRSPRVPAARAFMSLGPLWSDSARQPDTPQAELPEVYLVLETGYPKAERTLSYLLGECPIEEEHSLCRTQFVTGSVQSDYPLSPSFLSHHICGASAMKRFLTPLPHSVRCWGGAAVRDQAPLPCFQLPWSWAEIAGASFSNGNRGPAPQRRCGNGSEPKSQ